MRLFPVMSKPVRILCGSCASSLKTQACLETPLDSLLNPFCLTICSKSVEPLLLILTSTRNNPHLHLVDLLALYPDMQATGLPPLCFKFPLKSTSPVDFLEAAASGCWGDLPPSVAAFFQSLNAGRNKILETLKNPEESSSEKLAEVDVALKVYLSRINYLLLPKPGTCGRQEGLGGLTLQGLVRFSWTSVLGGGVVSGNDVRFEIASILLSTAFWKARIAAQCANLEDMEEPNQNSSLSYKLFRESAGLVEHVLRVTNLIKESPAVDCKQQTLNGLLKSLLAEAEGLTTLRAIANKHADSLIARLAYDVQDLYQESISELKAGGAKFKEFLSYLEYKSASFKSVSYLFESAVSLGKMQGGLAVRFANEAKKESENAQQLQDGFDPAALASFASSLVEFQAKLVAAVNGALEKAETDNSKVYYERVPEALPEIHKERLVFPIPFEFPVPDSTVDRSQALSADWKDVSRDQSNFEVTVDLETQESTDEKPSASANDPDYSCWRFLLVILVAPILLAVSIIGVLVWIILLPVKVFCCPVGCAVQILWSITEWFVKAPLRASLWAAGEPWKPKTVDKNDSQPK